MDLALAAGTVSTVIFATANLPMIVKAVRTRDLASYSLPSLVLINAGNVVHTIYIVSLPVGPVWVLHGFYLVSMGVMVTMHVALPRLQRRTQPRAGRSMLPSGRLTSRREGHGGSAPPPRGVMARR